MLESDLLSEPLWQQAQKLFNLLDKILILFSSSDRYGKLEDKIMDMVTLLCAENPPGDPAF